MNLADELREAAPEVLASLLAPLLTATAVALAAVLTRPPTEEAREDELLDIKAARVLLGNVSTDFLYRSPQLKNVRLKLGSRVFFSRRKIQAFIERRAGR
jgi:hypothetical protein